MDTNDCFVICANAACGWTGKVSDTVHPKHWPQDLLCPECREVVERIDEMQGDSMKQGHFEQHWIQEVVYTRDGTVEGVKTVPAGGVSTGKGFTISWQNGLIDSEPNGAFVEDVLQAVIGRIEFYENHFPCQENKDALTHLRLAAQRLEDRTKDREARQVLNTHSI